LWALALAAALLAVLPILSATTGWPPVALFEAFYRSGALVFGGGHVVLPLLQAAVVEPGWVTKDAFLSGYGLAQALPGPLFTFSAYLGASMSEPFGGIGGGLTALIAIFLPGLLLVFGMLPFANVLRTSARASTAVQGANAAVVGILAAAFYDPVLRGSVFGGTDALLAAAGFCLLVFGKMPSWLVVLLVPAAALLFLF
jgi:chromate transporter